jgi:hypothetical protein
MQVHEGFGGTGRASPDPSRSAFASFREGDGSNSLLDSYIRIKEGNRMNDSPQSAGERDGTYEAFRRAKACAEEVE